MSDTKLHFPDELEPFDLLMLRGESDPRNRGSTMTVMLLDKTPAFDRVLREFERISREFIRLRQRVVIPSVPVTAARWVVDPDFAIEYHVNRQVLPAPGDRRALLEVAERVLAAPMDLARPLWEVVLVEGLKGQEGEAALIMKAHHAIADGVGGLQLLRSMYDFKPNAPERPMPLEPVPEELTPEDVTRRGLRRELGNAVPRVQESLRWLREKGEALVASPRATIGDWREYAESLQRVMGELPAEPSPLLARRGINRRLFDFGFPLERIKRGAKKAGCSVNDAYLAGLGAAMRRYHEANGVHVEEIPLAMPVNVRKESDPAGGNRFAGARLALPVAETNAARRMQIVRTRAREAIEEPALMVMDLMGPIMSRMPDAVLNSMAGSVASIDIQASNVPGLTEAPYFVGSKMVRFIPFGPLPGVAMMVVLYSQAGYCSVGINYDTDAFDDTELLERCLVEGFEEVLAPAPAARKRKPRKKSPARRKAT